MFIASLSNVYPITFKMIENLNGILQILPNNFFFVWYFNKLLIHFHFPSDNDGKEMPRAQLFLQYIIFYVEQENIMFSFENKMWGWFLYNVLHGMYTSPSKSVTV